MRQPERGPGRGQCVELRWGPPPRDRQVVRSRTEVLADRRDRHARGRQVRERRDHLVFRLPQPDHEPRLHDEPRICSAREHREAPRIARRGSHRPLQARNRLDVVVQDVGPCVEDEPERGVISPAVRDQDLHGRARAAAPNGFDGRCDGTCTAVGEVVTRHTGDHRMGEPHPLDGLRDSFRLCGVERQRVPRVDQAEPARAGAASTVHHEGCRPVGPALEDVRTARLLADGDEPGIVDRPPERQVAVPHPCRHAEPVRLARAERHTGVRIGTCLAEPPKQRSLAAGGEARA